MSPERLKDAPQKRKARVTVHFGGGVLGRYGFVSCGRANVKRTTTSRGKVTCSDCRATFTEAAEASHV